MQRLESSRFPWFGMAFSGIRNTAAILPLQCRICAAATLTAGPAIQVTGGCFVALTHTVLF